ncbi:deoxyribodipyrimidine photo-lyase [Verrucomicrobiales bacterium BCK34]|nr:deoxyribodipyrimidine photo-lyase [Verrucomicrobiales bacterium BCK34]
MAHYKTVIHWFRRDLRLTDNVALYNAAQRAEFIVPLYVASEWAGEHAWTGVGRQAFLCGSLASLSNNIEHAGGKLVIRRGDALEELERLIDEVEAGAVFFNRDPDPFGRTEEKKVRELCRSRGIDCCDFQDVVLHEPGEILTGSRTPYKVYTPYSKKWFDEEKPEPVGRVGSMQSPSGIESLPLPQVEDWGLSFDGDLLRSPGEDAAGKRLDRAVEEVIGGYAETRNDPFADATSHLGADLRYGTISVREVYHRAEKARKAARSEPVRNSINTFQKQLGWREFFMAILHHFPEVLETDFNADWRGLQWDDPADNDKFTKWKEGRTGFPIVDAGMRQLAETGYMHNRVRMITAMFLTKDLHVHWKLGESHFMQHLLDGEIANNNGGWQWSAGTGADAAPYFRIQNPWTQTGRYDKDGRYIKRWLPELEKVDPKRFTKPPGDGKPIADDYVLPIVDHGAEREETLARFKAHRESR